MELRIFRFLWAVLALGAAPAVAGPPNKDDAELARYDAAIKPKHRQHWAFQLVKQPPIPAVKNRAWVNNPIDAFVLAKLEQRGWQPAPAAEPRVLLRRLYLDLVGVPPTLAEQAELAAKLRANRDAIDKVVDDLLARPGYGERWGRHWLDLVRYAESNGYERDAGKPNVWRYRGYVIRSFNADKPYDRFIREQLAGDELPDASTETVLATGFYRLGPWDDEPADPAEDRFDQLDDIISTTSQVFLGLTMGCARCHNHKFDPLTMHDYYRLAAVFNPLKRPQYGRFDLDLPAGSYAQVERLNNRDREIAALSKQAAPFQLLAVQSPAAAAAASVARTTIDEQIRHLRERTPDLPGGYFLHETSPSPPVTNLLLRGKASRPGPKVEPGMPAILVSRQPGFPPPSRHTSQRRLTLARWIASGDNPLTARVIVNRVWQYHFGDGLVRTPSDFGFQGQPPTHPELLDWLADWFVKEGWSIKKLHRLILTSNTYRMSKRWNPTYAAEDPENRLLWRMPYRRLEVEAIRDSVLAVSGRLNPAMYGPSMYPFVPKEAMEGHSDPDKIWPAFNETEASRRTVYAFVKRSLVVPMLEVLDLCDTTRSAAKRQVTTVAPQALSLFNGDFVNRQARHLADRLLREAGDDPAKQVDLAYRLALCRRPTAAEQADLVSFLTRDSSKDARVRALQQVARVIFNLNEFVYPD